MDTDITQRHLKMITPSGFDSVFEQERLDYETDTAAFNALNREYCKVFGRPRYKNFKSFHSARFQRINA